MHKKLLALLRSFNQHERVQFLRFLNSPFFNENGQALELYLYLLKFEPHFLAEDMSPQEAYQTVFGCGGFDKNQFNKLASALFKLSGSFLAHYHLQEDPFQQGLNKLDYYQSRQLFKHFQGLERKLRLQMEKPRQQEAVYFRRQLALEMAAYENLSQQDDRTGDVNLQAVNDALDQYYFFNKLMALGRMANRQKITRVDYRVTGKEAMLAYLESADAANHPLIRLYLQVYYLQSKPKAEKKRHYLAVRQMLEQYWQQLPPGEAFAFYTYLQNNVKDIFSVEEYFQEHFQLYQAQIERGLLFQNGCIPHSLFRNVTGAAIAIKKYDWALRFMEENRDKIIPREYAEDAYALNMATLLVFQDAFGEALDWLNKAHPKDIYYKLSFKSLQARIYYELKEVILLENFLNAFTRFVFYQKDKISREKVDSYRNFVNYLRKVLKLIIVDAGIHEAYEKNRPVRDPAGRDSLKRLLKQVRSTPMFYGKQWLIGKAEGLLE